MLRNRLYYSLKPFLPRGLRMMIRRAHARRIARRAEGVWPILESAGTPPAGWSGWPDGKQFAVVLTHDVESLVGLGKVRSLAEMEMSLGFRSSFNFVPEGEYRVPDDLRHWLMENGFEVGIHDHRHDGKLYRSRCQFRRSAERINHYLAAWGAVGFRSGFMLHNLDWIHDLNIAYDASTFDTDPFEPQPDGIGTIFPFWVPAPGQRSEVNGQQLAKDGYVELPYTLVQDSTLFLLLGETSPAVWKHKADWIVKRGGMVLLNQHPDYIRFSPCSSGFDPAYYREFLLYLKECYAGAFWSALPREVAERQAGLRTLAGPEGSHAGTKGDTPQTAVGASGPRGALADKRVLVVLYSHVPGDPRPQREAGAMVEAGAKVELICLREDAAQPRRETWQGIDVTRVPLKKRRGGILMYLWQYSAFFVMCAGLVTARCLSRRYDLVHVHNMPDFLVFTGLVPRLLGARMILDLHDPMPELLESMFGLKNNHWVVRHLRWIERLSIAFSDVVLTPNLAFRELFSSRSCSPAKIQIIMNSPKETIFDPEKVAACAVQEAGTRENGEYRLMHHGLIAERHGLDIAIEAVHHLRPRLPGVRLDIYGHRTVYLDELQRLIERLGLGDCVQYMGPRSLQEIATAIMRTDLGLVPNRRNPFTEINMPTRIFEYLAMRKPVLVADTRGIRDYFDDGSMLFFRPGDAAQLADRIEWVRQYPQESGVILAAGIEVYRRHRWAEERERLLSVAGSLV